MIFKIYPVGMLQANCYIIGDENSKEGIIVDPGGDAVKILNECEKNELKIKYIVLTHGHGDHIGAVQDIKLATNSRIIMNSRDEFLTKGANKKIFPIFRNLKDFDIDEYINNGDIISADGIDIEVIETPGHTPGGVCFKIGNILLSGDTLFQGSVGRCDLEFGSYETLIKSIKEKLLILPDDTIVYPGHGDKTTIGYEKKYNPYIQ